MNETQGYLRKLIHEVGLELRSSAVCTGVRRTRDGPFGLQEALARQHWTATDIQRAIKMHRPMLKTLSSRHAEKSPAEQLCPQTSAEHATASVAGTVPKHLQSPAGETAANSSA